MGEGDFILNRPAVIAAIVLQSLALGIAAAQPARPAIQRGEAGSMVLQSSVDLAARDVGFNGLGEIVFTLKNFGGISVNDKYDSKAVSTPPIRIDLYVSNKLLQSIYQQSLAARGSQLIAVKLVANVPKCKESRDLKVVVDPMNQIRELHDDNNAISGTFSRPCPDLAVQKIEKTSQGIAGETYGIKVTVINLGNAASPESQTWATSMSSAPGITGWPEFVPLRTLESLAPGEASSFYVGGSVASFDHSWVRVFVDFTRVIDELDESNDLVDKKL